MTDGPNGCVCGHNGDCNCPFVPSAEQPAPKKRKKSTSPTKRTLDAARKRGYIVQVVERWNAHARVRVDLFGVIDLVAVRPTEDKRGLQIVGVQATSENHHADRRTKILAEPRAKLWCDAGGVIELWSWGKRGPQQRWTPRVEVFTSKSWVDPWPDQAPGSVKLVEPAA